MLDEDAFQNLLGRVNGIHLCFSFSARPLRASMAGDRINFSTHCGTGVVMVKMLKFSILVALFVAGCMTADEKSGSAANCPIDTVTVKVHDTVRVVQKDTIRLVQRDTVRLHDTTIYRDTIIIHDTLVAGVHDTTTLSGIWEGASGGKDITLAFTASIISDADFTLNVGATSQNGYIKNYDGTQGKITWGGYHAVTWIFSLNAGVLVIQEVGDKLFPGATTTLHRR